MNACMEGTMTDHWGDCRPVEIQQDNWLSTYKKKEIDQIPISHHTHQF